MNKEKSGAQERPDGFENEVFPKGKTGVFRRLTQILKDVTTKVQRSLEGAPEVSSETIRTLADVVDVLPQGEYKTIFAGVLKVIESMDAATRKQIREQSVSASSDLLIAKGKKNADVLLLLRGAWAVYLSDNDIIPSVAPGFAGEISINTGGLPVADVEATEESLVLRIPHHLFEELCEKNTAIDDAKNAIMGQRLEMNRNLAALKESDQSVSASKKDGTQAKGVESAQVLAEIAMLLHGHIGSREPSIQDNLLAEVANLATTAKGIFHMERIDAGRPFIREGDELASVSIILQGSANMLVHGRGMGVMRPGDFIGPTDAFSLTRRSQFEYSAIEPLTILKIDASAFLVLRSKIQASIQALSADQQKLMRRREGGSDVPSVPFSHVKDKVYVDIHEQAARKNHYMPLRSSGTDLFECGRAEQVLCWLGVRGLLSYNGMTGWELVGKTADAFTLKMPAMPSINVSYDALVTQNLRLALPLPKDAEEAMEKYHACGLGFEQARFLVERGIVPPKEPNIAQLTIFQKSFASIQDAISYIEGWVDEKPDDPKRQKLGHMLPLLLIDTAHQIGITTLMKNPATRDLVLDQLAEMIDLPTIDDAGFKKWIETEGDLLREKYAKDVIRWNGIGSTTKTISLKVQLLLDGKWGELYKLSSADLTLTQAKLLSDYVARLDQEVCPNLVRDLESLFATKKFSDGRLPIITGRTKNEKGILDKLRRVQNGNRGKKAKKDFCLADLPDAVGARVIVGNVLELEQTMIILEQNFADAIIEKDDFYGNPAKQKHPYRLITYTVLCDGVPVEIQLQTLKTGIAAAIDHDVVYKPYNPADLEERELSYWLLLATAYAETQERHKNGFASMSTLDAAKEQVPMRHMFQSATKSGRCMCAYVTEESETWKEDLTEARRYFQWHQTAGEQVTMHHGSSTLDCSACIGVPTWPEFRRKKLQEITDKLNEKMKLSTGIDTAPLVEFIHSLHHQKVPLFVLEALGSDLAFHHNKSQFQKTVRQHFTETECARLYKALAIADKAHAGQSYANDKIDDATGKPKYPSSFALKQIPYSNHCVQVADLAISCGLSADTVTAALLHDVVEDTDMTLDNLKEKGISDEVCTMVDGFTKREGEKREDFMTRIRQLPDEPKIAKEFCDRFHNLLRAFNLRDNPKYLRRIVSESKETLTSGDFNQHVGISHLVLRFTMLVEVVEQYLNREYPSVPTGEKPNI